MKKILLLLSLLVCTIGSWATIITVNGHNLPNDVGSIEINSTHSQYGIIAGKIAWNPAKNLLTLNGLNMSVANHAIEVDGTGDVRIELIGNNSIDVNGPYYGFNLYGSATYTIASGASVPYWLNVYNTNGNPATAAIRAGRPLTIDHCNLSLVAPNAIRGNSTPLTLKEANIKATGAVSGSVTSFSSITYEHTKCRDYSYSSSLKGIASNGNIVNSEVYFYREYPIYVKDASIQVTDLNKNDILGDGGSMYYTEYGYPGGILHFKDNANIDFGTAVVGIKLDNRYDRDAYIVTHKNVTLKSMRGTTIQSVCPLHIYSDASNIGQLNIYSNETAIGCTNDLTISNIDINIKAEKPLSNWAMNNTNVVSFVNTNATLINSGYTNPAVGGFADVTFGQCCITGPTSASYVHSSEVSGRYFTHFGEMVRSLEVKRGKDEISPTLPANKELNVEGVTESSCVIRWDAAEDNLTAQQNLLYSIDVKNGNEAVKTYNLPKGDTYASITDLQPNTTYTIAVKVADEAGGYSVYNTQTITTLPLIAYDLWVAGIQVTSRNQDNVLDDSYVPSVTFNPETNTLTISRWQVELGSQNYDYSIVNGIAGLEIKAVGRSLFQGTKGMIYSTEYFSVVGTSDEDCEMTSYIFDDRYPAIYALGGMSITNCSLMPYGVIEGGDNLFIYSSNLLCKKIIGFNSVVYDRCVLRSPQGGAYDTTNKVLENGKDFVEFRVYREYDLKVAGIQVTSDNAYDILGDGKVQYDRRQNVLILDNATIGPKENSNGIFTSIDNLKVRLIGHNVLTGWYGGAIDSKGKNLTIEGYTPSRSTLICKNQAGDETYDGSIFVSSSTTIRNCSVNVGLIMGGLDPDGEYGTDDYHVLTINRARIKTSDNITNFDEIMIRNSYIKSPQDCSYNEGYLYYVDGSNNRVNSIEIEPCVLEVNNQGVMGNTIASKSGTITFDAETNTLNMVNAELGDRNTIGLVKMYDDIKINVQGQNNLLADAYALEMVAGDLTVTGSGSLNIYVSGYGLVESFDSEAAHFRSEQFVTLKNTTFNCTGNGYLVYTPDFTYNVINSNLNVTCIPAGNSLSFVHHEVNLKHSYWRQPDEYYIPGPYSQWLSQNVVIEAEGTVPGDLDGNGELTINDLSLMVKYLNQGGTEGFLPTMFDINNDGKFDEQDVQTLSDLILVE